MRLQLNRRTARPLDLGIFLLCALCPLPASGQSRVSTRVDLYADDWITVVAPAGMARIALGEGSSAELDMTVDQVSGATQVLNADLVSSATRFSETRYEGNLSATFLMAPTWTLGGRYGLSAESDYHTQSGGLQGSLEVLQRMATVSASYQVSLERVGAADDPGFEQSLVGQSLDLSWNQVLGPRASLVVLFNGQHHACGSQLGCQASPYRYVALLDEDLLALAVRERHPSQRTRGAAALRYHHKLRKEVALHAGYRFYRDSWQITGHTADASLAGSLAGERLIVRLDSRFSQQSAAFFYQDRYAAGGLAEETDSGLVPAWRTGDRELSGLHNLMAGMRVESTWSAVGPFLTLGLSARVARLWYRYPNYSELPTRDAWVLGGGLLAEF